MYNTEKNEFAVIGSGWYGTHIALVLKGKYPACEVTLFEKNSDIFSEISGKFGIRLHSGLHYPRSEQTRIACHKGFSEFYRYYPELITPHMYSVYGLGILDESGIPSKVDKEKFAAVCRELENYSEIQPAEWGYNNLSFAVNVEEPSLVLGTPLRNFFKASLNRAGVKLLCNFHITEVAKGSNNRFIVSGEQSGGCQQTSFIFSHVINATSYQALAPNPKKWLPFKIEMVYQPCLALMYEYTERPLPKLPFSFIVMDGWFPCLMPYDDRTSKEEVFSKYIMTHGKWTILSSYETANEAKDCLASINDEFVSQRIIPCCERDMERFWPEFKQKFIYVTWIGAVLAKIKTEREFRSAVTFQNEENGMIYVIPGKVSNIFDVGEEVLDLVELSPKKVIREGEYCYVKSGVLFAAKQEITEKPKDISQNTCELRPYGKTAFGPG